MFYMVMAFIEIRKYNIFTNWIQGKMCDKVSYLFFHCTFMHSKSGISEKKN